MAMIRESNIDRSAIMLENMIGVKVAGRAKVVEF